MSGRSVDGVKVRLDGHDSTRCSSPSDLDTNPAATFRYDPDPWNTSDE
jgi:hypothetical protein